LVVEERQTAQVPAKRAENPLEESAEQARSQFGADEIAPEATGAAVAVPT
jgi:hypothetical protein